MKCIGNHRWNEWEHEDEELPDAEYFRECAYCGATVWLCTSCRERIFLCARCFSAQRTEGKDQARKIGRRRERKREWKRRARRRARADRIEEPDLFEERWA